MAYASRPATKKIPKQRIKGCGSTGRPKKRCIK